MNNDFYGFINRLDMAKEKLGQQKLPKLICTEKKNEKHAHTYTHKRVSKEYGEIWKKYNQNTRKKKL